MKIFSVLLLIFITIAISCNFNNEKDNNFDNKKTTTEFTRKLLIEDYDFAVIKNNKFIPYNKAIYHRGDEVYMVLKNVGLFALGKDSLNHAEMKFELSDAIGQIITIRKNLFGERGHAAFNDNILKKPYASYQTDNNNKIGKYNFKITIYDLVSGDSTSVSDEFYIE